MGALFNILLKPRMRPFALAACLVARKNRAIRRVELEITVPASEVVDKYGNTPSADLTGPTVEFPERVLAEARKHKTCDSFVYSDETEQLLRRYAVQLQLQYPKLFDDDTWED